MNKFSKLAITAGVVGAVGVAGSFGTYAAFTADPVSDSQNLKTANVALSTENLDFSNPSTIGTRSGENDHKASYVIHNDSDVPVNAYYDFDGETSTAGANVVYNNLQIDTYVDNGVSNTWFGGATTDRLEFPNLESSRAQKQQKPGYLDQGFRLAGANNRGYTPIYDVALNKPALDPENKSATPLLKIPANSSVTLYTRLQLRETDWVGPDSADKAMENQMIPVKLNVALIEAGAAPDGTVFSTANDNGGGN